MFFQFFTRESKSGCNVDFVSLCTCEHLNYNDNLKPWLSVLLDKSVVVKMFDLYSASFIILFCMLCQ
jgi:hypothetical protein